LKGDEGRKEERKENKTKQNNHTDTDFEKKQKNLLCASLQSQCSFEGRGQQDKKDGRM